MGGTPLKVKQYIQITSGVVYENGTPLMQPEGEVRNVYKLIGKEWYYNNETQEIKQL